MDFLSQNKNGDITMLNHSNKNIITAVRQDIIGELEAINQYNQHISQFDNAMAKGVWQSIKNEERVHVGELMALLQQLCPDEAKKLQDGYQEVEEIISNLR